MAKTTVKTKSKASSTLEQNKTNGSGLERIIFFSDAVFAIAITLLALEIRIPASEVPLSEAGLSAFLSGNWHQYLAYAISFLVIGSFWMSHHRKFHFIRAYDGNLMNLNLLFLMVIAFMPFPSSVISEYENRTGTIFYAMTLSLAGLLLAALWAYASGRANLVDQHLDRAQRVRQLVAPLLLAAIFGLSAGVAYVEPNLARLCWLLILPVTFFANRGLAI
jgi:uncharacterized membrane protein